VGSIAAAHVRRPADHGVCRGTSDGSASRAGVRDPPRIVRQVV